MLAKQKITHSTTHQEGRITSLVQPVKYLEGIFTDVFT